MVLLDSFSYMQLMEGSVLSSPGSYQISPYMANIILNEDKIKIENG